MKAILAIILFCALSSQGWSALFQCQVFVPEDGRTPVEGMRYVRWDASLELQDAAQSLAVSLLRFTNECNKPIIIKAHGYGATVAYYILGLGKRFYNLYPAHPYVKIYDKTLALYSYNGSFNGTPLMDQICAGNNNSELSELLGNSCQRSLTTVKNYLPTSDINSPGLLVYLTSSVSTNHFNETAQKILDNYNLDLHELYEADQPNLSDGILPLFSTSGCAENVVMTDSSDNCSKINDEFFTDLVRLEDFHHYQIYDNPEIVQGFADED